MQILKSGQDVPLDYRNILFPPEKIEYELVYAGKEREEDIIADVMPAPLQPIRTISDNDGGWTNKLVFGDNLQVLKSFLSDGNVKGQVKLIYIDPPFGTGEQYDARGEIPAFSAKLQGVRYLDFLRKRLVLLKHILANDGSIYVRIDYHFGHYVKVLMDEIFGKTNFRNEMIVNRTKKVFEGINRFNTATDSVFFYTKSGHYTFNGFRKKRAEQKWVHMHSPGIRWTKVDKGYLEKYDNDHLKEKNGQYLSRGRVYKGKVVIPPPGRHWTFTQKRLEQYDSEGRIRKHPRTGMLQYLTKDTELVDSNWTDIPGYSFRWNYPTENSEELLERIISASSKQGDIVLDAFAGAGTTGAVAEKLGRRWIMIDSGKLAIYTVQKRLLNLKRKIGNKGEPVKPKPFTLYHAGLYDLERLSRLPWEDWRRFTLQLFNCREEKHKVSGVELDGYRERSDVLVFNHMSYPNLVLDHGFIDNLHSVCGSKLGREFFVIAPAGRVTFLEDYVEKDETRYHILRVAHSLVDEIVRKDFEAIKQPFDEQQVNDIVEAGGFGFIHPPKVQCEYVVKKPSGELFDVASIRIRKFKNEPMIKGTGQPGNRETLAEVMVDFNYDGKVFKVDQVYYANEIKKNDWEVQFPVEQIKGKIMIVYLDVYGNEYREVKSLPDFVGISKN